MLSTLLLAAETKRKHSLFTPMLRAYPLSAQHRQRTFISIPRLLPPTEGFETCARPRTALVLKGADLPNTVRCSNQLHLWVCRTAMYGALPVVCVEEGPLQAIRFTACGLGKKAQDRSGLGPCYRVGPLVSAERQQFVLGWIEKAVRRGMAAS